MNAAALKPGFTLIDLLVSTAIVGLSMAFVLPVVQAGREVGRRQSCINKVHEIGIAMSNYASTHSNALPPSASLTNKGDRKTKTIGGYSFLVKLLPFMEMNNLYKMLPPRGDPEDSSNQDIADVTAERVSAFECPSAPSASAPQPRGAKQTAAITNYKTVGASTRDSLKMVVAPGGKPPYGHSKLHPDGAVFPSEKNIPLTAITDGTSHTIMIMETIDEAASRWTVGKEATLVGLPQASSPTGEKPARHLLPGHTGLHQNHFAPRGYDSTFGDDSGVAKAGLRTFLAYAFSPNAADAGKYEDAGFGNKPADYGPSSSHPGVVICGTCDGGVHPLSRKIDAANLFFLITKSGNDPFNLPDDAGR